MSYNNCLLSVIAFFRELPADRRCSHEPRRHWHPLWHHRRLISKFHVRIKPTDDWDSHAVLSEFNCYFLTFWKNKTSLHTLAPAASSGELWCETSAATSGLGSIAAAPTWDIPAECPAAVTRPSINSLYGTRNPLVLSPAKGRRWHTACMFASACVCVYVPSSRYIPDREVTCHPFIPFNQFPFVPPVDG